jgi:hypothetical protein
MTVEAGPAVTCSVIPTSLVSTLMATSNILVVIVSLELHHLGAGCLHRLKGVLLVVRLLLVV